MAGSKTDTFETAFLNLVFNNTNIANIGDATGLRGSSTAGSLYIALFTVLPSDSTAGTEANYTSYARVAVARSAAGWTISGANCYNTAIITFPTSTGGTNTIVGFGIMTASSSGTLLFWGDLTSSLLVTTGIVPQFSVGSLIINED